MTVTFNLPPRCTLVQAEGIASDCRAAIEAGGGVSIDATALEEADVSLLQILIAARETCESAGKGFTLTPSPVLDELAARAGFTTSAEGLRAASAAPLL